ncbi:DUF2147 domain-containing protein [Epilithonimonas mollis]|uniref:DUF2147 domain-containing protein n=1 Tax=Epilithonimonas mollis TaxID=216903 RepID=A0A1M6MXB5_9FLAO|nr:DUF2147 domain-containing protein [Epilithonimonas mollis]SHJ88076.1 hypothetical protein SAMN05444371_0018 [Epilithonimonas mollis]
MKNLFKTSKIIFPLVFLLMGINMQAQNSPDKLLGKWANEDKTKVVEFVKNGPSYDAVILKSEDKSLIGKKQITGLKFQHEGNYNNGTVHIIKKGKTASCTVKITKDQLTVKASYGIMSKTQVWTRL